MRLLFLIPIFFFICSQAQTGTQQENVFVQFDKNKSSEYGKLGKDSINILLNIRKANKSLPDIYIVKGKLLGDNSGAQVNIPNGLMDGAVSVSFTEYIALASNDNKNLISPREYASFSYQPFDFSFETLPPNAKLYLIPLEDWESIFNTKNPAYNIQINQLSLLNKYDVGKLTPCNYQVFEQPYIGVFVLQQKIKPILIIPKRNTPANNSVKLPL